MYACIEVRIDEVVICPGVISAVEVFDFGVEDEFEVVIVGWVHGVIDATTCIFKFFAVTRLDTCSQLRRYVAAIVCFVAEVKSQIHVFLRELS